MKLLIKILLPILTSSIVVAGNGSGTMKALQSIDERLAIYNDKSAESLGLMFQKNSDTSTEFVIAQKYGQNWQVKQVKVRNEELSQFNHLRNALENSKESGTWTIVK